MKRKISIFFWALIVAASLSTVIAEGVPISADEYGCIWWAYGSPYYRTIQPCDEIPSEYPGNKQVLCFHTGKYGMVIDTLNLNSIHYGRFKDPIPYKADIHTVDKAVFRLPQTEMSIEATVAGETYRCVGRNNESYNRNFPVKFVEYGRFFQHVMISGLIMQDSSGEILNADCWLEITSWPDSLNMMFYIGGTDVKPDKMRLQVDGRVSEAIMTDDGESYLVLSLFTDTDVANSNDVTVHAPVNTKVQVAGRDSYGCYYITIRDPGWSNKSKTFYPGEHLDRLDKWPVALRNNTDRPKVFRLLFDTVPRNITGYTPMILDEGGLPTGIPVQISKNWHKGKEKQKYQGGWCHSSTVITVPARTTYNCQYAIAYARWGGVPAASHAQLSLIGWGHNMMWDQCAVGSFGESICYEPGRVQRRGFITDVRPLMILGEKDDKKWGWSGNVGGGDFIVYLDKDGKYVPMIKTRGRYYNYGPNLTRVSYDEISRDESIRASYTVKLARVDDYLRVFQNIRYDVLKPVNFSRLAFCQMPSDYYNQMRYGKTAIGNVEGLVSEWDVQTGSWEYDKKSMPLLGRQPWVSLHDVLIKDDVTQAARGLIIRKWDAVLGGVKRSEPYLSTYMTESGRNNFRVAAELSPPPETKSLKVGDFVDVDIELVVLPSQTGLYYGPNKFFVKALEKYFNSWKMVHREAKGNDLKVIVMDGELKNQYPVEIAVSSAQRAQFTVSGGIGYVPLTFIGLMDNKGYSLYELSDDKSTPVDQSVNGHDFWQTDYEAVTETWSITYNINLDSSEESNKFRLFVFCK